MKYIVHEDQVEAKDLPGRKLKWLFTPEMGLTDGFTMNTVVIKPGNTVKPAHAHPDREEVIYIASGEGKVYIDGTVYDIRTGSAILFKAGSIHMVRNSGSEDMKVVCIFVPPATMDNYAFYEDIEFPETE